MSEHRPHPPLSPPEGATAASDALRVARATLGAYSYPGLDKAAFMAELAEHAAADRIIQGTYGDTPNPQGFRGCAVGCSLHSIQRRLGLARMDYRDHTLFETYLGVPRALARLEDCIFEGLPVAEARLWPQRFADAVQPGADLSGVWNQFASWLLREITLPVATREKTRAAIIAVAEGYETNWGTLTQIAAREQAYAAADANAYADAYAAYAAYAAAAAAAAYAYAAYAAAAAAAAYAADAYAYAAARQSAYSTMAAKLCELISAAPSSNLSVSEGANNA